MLIAAGNNGLALSLDGITWNLITSAPFSGLNCVSIVWNGSMWIVLFISGLAYSYDGINWLISSSGSTLLLGTTSGSLASRYVLPTHGELLATPYTPALRSNWPLNVTPPTTIGQALDLIGACLRTNSIKLSW